MSSKFTFSAYKAIDVYLHFTINLLALGILLGHPREAKNIFGV